MSIGATSRSSTAGLAVGRAEWLTYRFLAAALSAFLTAALPASS
jgi:hypothetical protein